MDRIIRCITSDGAIMAQAINSTYLVATMQQLHHTSAVATAALGRLLTASSMMGSLLKQSDASITLKVNGGGPLGTLVAISNGRGYCRGYVEHPEIDVPRKPNGKLDVGAAVGNHGLLGVIRDYGEGSPYIGQVELKSGEIAEDISAYYAASEQIPTVCALGVLVDKSDLTHILAGGMLVQVLPGADEEAISRLEQNIASMESVTTMLACGMSIEEMCKKALEGFEMEILDEYQVGYACTCSKERVIRTISFLSTEEIRSLATEHPYTEAKCQYCNRTYRISREELEKLAAKVSEEKQHR